MKATLSPCAEDGLRWQPSLWFNTRVALPDSQRDLLLVLAARLVPESSQLPEAERSRMLGLIDQVLADRTPEMRRQFSLFLGLLRWAPMARYGRRFDQLAPQQQDSTLRWLQNFPAQIIRSGFWGVRTLVMMGYYARPDVGAAIGYRPSDDGNAVLHARSRR